MYNKTRENDTRDKAPKLLSISILIVAIGVAFLMVKIGKSKAEKSSDKKVILAEVQTISPLENSPTIDVTGNVYADKNIQILSEVGGKVSWVSKNYQVGSKVAKGSVLLKIDDREAKLRIVELEAAVKAREISLLQEKSKADIAKREWSLSGEAGEANDLVSRKIFVENAELNLEAAKSKLKQAQITLSKHTVRASFAGVVTQELVDVGQVVNMNTKIGQLMSSKNHQLEVAVPSSLVQYLQDSKGKLLKTKVLIDDKNSNDEVEGSVIAVIPEIEASSRRVRVIIEIPNVNQKAKVLSGSFVQAKIISQAKINSLKIPRKAISKGNLIWTVDAKSKLKSLTIDPLWDEKEFVFVDPKLNEIDLVVSPIAAPLNGLEIKKVSGEHSE